jgi:hypothetical protein
MSTWKKEMKWNINIKKDRMWRCESLRVLKFRSGVNKVFFLLRYEDVLSLTTAEMSNKKEDIG